MSAYIFTIKQNDRRPNLVVNLFNADGTPLDLTLSTSILFSMRRNSVVKINKADATILDGPNGKISYIWQAGDTDTIGKYEAEFEVTWVTGITQTMPNDDYIKVVVIDDIA